MTQSPSVAPVEAAWIALEGQAGSLAVVDVAAEGAPSEFGRRYPAQYVRLPPDAEEVAAALAERGRRDAAVFLRAEAAFLLGEGFERLLRRSAASRANVKIVAFEPEEPRLSAGAWGSGRDDLATVRAMPAMAVVAPADAASTRTAVEVLAARDGPAYLRLPPRAAPECTDGSFVLGRAAERRAGSDLAFVAYGPGLAPALAAAEALARVGVSVRVLDVASIKPFDQAAVLRAARDTGALLSVEAAPLATGVGTLVAAITAENHPVPVRRLGWPDVSEPGAGDAASARVLPPVDRLVDEAWELLRLRGKVE